MAAERTEGLIKTFTAGGDIYPFRVVRFGANEDTVLQSSATSQAHIGVARIPLGREYPVRLGESYSTSTIKVILGDAVDVVMSDIAEVEYGGTVNPGSLLTVDAQGRAVEASLPLGANVRVIGMATVSGVSGDIGCVFLFPQMVSGYAGQGNTPATAEFVIGAEATNAITVQTQIKDVAGNNVTSPVVVDVYLSSASTGIGVVGTAPSGGEAIAGGNGAIIAEPNTNKAWKVVTSAAGRVDLTFTEAGAATYYLVVVINGRIFVSGAITFA